MIHGVTPCCTSRTKSRFRREHGQTVVMRSIAVGIGIIFVASSRLSNIVSFAGYRSADQQGHNRKED